ncbi:MAG: hypothetical protein RL846_09245, partial [Deltaproteobacteria bacterium]
MTTPLAPHESGELRRGSAPASWSSGRRMLFAGLVKEGCGSAPFRRARDGWGRGAPSRAREGGSVAAPIR